MNRYYVKLSVLICLCVIGLSTAKAGGRNVTVYLRDGSAMIGELVRVRADGISIYTLQQDVSDETLLLLPRHLTDIPLSNIQRITSEGQSHIVAGMLIGTGVGLATGAAIAAVSVSNTPEPKNPLDAFGTAMGEGIGAAAITGIGLLGGLAVGTLVGAAASSSDLEMHTFDIKELTKLSEAARFPNQGRAGYGVTSVPSKFGFATDDRGHILSVIPGSPAFVGEFRYSDSLVAINANALPIGSTGDIRKLLNSGDSLSVILQRGNETLVKKLVK